MDVATSSYLSRSERHAAAWLGRDMKGGDAFLRLIPPDVITALEKAAEETRTVPLDYLQPYQFATGAIPSLMQEVDDALIDGAGVVRLTGLPVRRWSADQSIRAYWGLALHLGNPEIQDVAGSRISHVKQDTGRTNVRGFKGNKELTFHCDAYELLGLMCLEKAASGGTTKLVSAEAVFRILMREHPEAIEPLLRGFWHLPLEAGGNPRALTRFPVPVISISQQRIRCMYLPKYMRDAAQAMNIPFPKELENALRLFREIANRKALVCEFDLEPGDVLFCNNFTVLHSRTEFTDGERPRHLVRLWLTSRTARIIDPALLERGNVYNRLHAEQGQAS